METGCMLISIFIGLKANIRYMFCALSYMSSEMG